MTNKEHHRITGLVAVLTLSTLLAMTPAVFAAGEVTIDLSGDMVPGGTVVATVVINDASTFSSAIWTQTAGVEASATGAQVLTVVLGPEGAYRDNLFLHLTEPPITEEQLPPNVELPEGEFPGGLPARWGTVGVNPFALEEAALVSFDVTVVTSSGTYELATDIHTTLPWKVATGTRNVPLGIPVLLNGAEQAAYDWVLSPPSGSSATLMGATAHHPDFTPDVAGLYRLAVTDEASGDAVTIDVYAGTWRGIIVGKDENNRPIADPECIGCHSGYAPDKFTPWAQSGHAEIFSSQLDTSTHYGEGCFACHTVGFDTGVMNNGVDEAADYQAFLDSGLINTPGDNWTTVLAQFPETAKKANIQCENCHGPQDSAGHQKGAPRQNLSSDICATCHGEPLRHARFQQWQLSGHANYELAIDEGMSGSCSKCHSANGFLAWLPVLTGEVAGDVDDNVTVTWTENDIHPQTCAVCHDPHDMGSVSGDTSNATVRISGDTPMLAAGFIATDVGRGAMCMTCHNSRRGLRNDGNWDDVGASDPIRASHGGPQSDVMMGQNAYFVNVGERSFHSNLEDACVTCHMEATPPPADLAYNGGGTNHTFFARNDICVECHSLVVAEDVQGPFEAGMLQLADALEAEYLKIITAQTAAGNTIDFAGQTTITSADQVAELIFGESRGRQGLAVNLVDGTMIETQSLASIKAVTPSGDATAIYEYGFEELLKASWNYTLLHSDGSEGVHNPTWTKQVLAHSISTVASGGSNAGGNATGPGVSCNSQYTYWAEIATHAPGDFSSVWRTDVVARNANSAAATIQFILHTNNAGNVTLDGLIPAMSQGVYEDIVGVMGVESNKGALEICSDMPLEVVARIFSQSAEGTFGQFIDGLTNFFGLTEGQTARLLGLRQMTDEYRTNISVTNTGSVQAEVAITLYGTDGAELTTYNLTVNPGMVTQDLGPFASRAHMPDLGWGFAEVEVVTGAGILCSASVVDSNTNDGTTIPMKR